ncbi:acylneuraminate cytidylyltransferase family protein [Candidatus Peregrinibacteria bacterium CG10_big_fil_rev_8_21_14_0_10_42_8]|nr:MAG: acylneuraminate cytidylyltransferase family protein [Candidatus Peregrinibacteria bacterium CG10_big_fil_rev_8_21_14_0_10_42_8]
MNILITICARGGSKGVPGKNIKSVAGKPLIAYTIEQAKVFAELHDVDIALSTDSDDIRSTAAQYGLETAYIRPQNLSGDSASKESAMRDVLFYFESQNGKRYDLLFDLDVTSPLRTQKDLEGALLIFETQSDVMTLFSANPAARNPYFNMVEQDSNGYYHLCKQSEVPIVSRQQAPKVFDLNASFFCFRREFFDGPSRTPFTDKSVIYEMQHMCFDLDEPLDYEMLNYLIKQDRLDFDFGS